MREPTTERGMATKQKLLQAAEQVFGERGYHAASIVEITRTAGVGVGTFYEYFDSKETIFRELVEHMSHQLRRRIAERVAALPNRLERERAGFEAFFRYALEHRNLYRIVLESQFVDEPLYKWYYQRLADGYKRGLKEALQRGEIRGPATDSETYLDTLAFALLGMGQMLGMRWVLWEGRVPPAEVLEELAELIRRLLSPHPEAAARVGPAKS
ncbi:TetR/AcrR family transcriptional regulator [Hydrogenibacillus sp. N12]|uniref:TetR/AcrR family transcriptional regulator n=1 Tax=Hydrogenibacillus sp. N12 TaxID=2866627 RepID=UPI001C7D2CC0|nr:TetR/AcrR family transcriptional regulator [Hydrogenibacillus sp. N12]QZA32159.1 TetR/AcrR family transcriptional regulator [Hydrogenibacillus sp. N12]